MEASGERWPPGWVKGKGYPPPESNLSGYTVRSAAIRAIEVNQKATEGSKADDRREVDRYLPEDGPLAAMPVEKVTVDAIHDWHILSRGAVATPVVAGPSRPWMRARRCRPRHGVTPTADCRAACR